MGGQKRTIVCACGWGTKDSVRASNMKLKMHQKLCSLTTSNQPIPFDPKMNGFNGMTYSNRGNLQHQPLIANLNSGNEVVAVCDAKDAYKLTVKK